MTYNLGFDSAVGVVEVPSTSIQAASIAEDHNFGKDHSLSYLLGFAAVGLFFSILSFALTPTEYLSEGAVALASEMQTVTGLNIADIAIPTKLELAEHSAH